MIDTHCHLTFPEFRDRVPEVLAEAAEAGVTGLITISTTSVDCEHALAIARAHERVWCSAGVHPLYADKGPHDWARITRVAADPKCVAWGELGLDRHYDEPPFDLQVAVLDEQLEVIRGTTHRPASLPIILHCRDAFDDLIPRLEATGLDPARFVFHCFTGGPDEARRCLDFGAMISFTGVVTYPNAREVAAAATLVPADRILIETDAPFLAPAPHRGKRPCRPAWVRHTAEFIADARGLPFDEFHRIVNDNTARFFGIDAR
ncbi:MAG: TatD family hydrolase [Phycisphaerales bacterium JB037]